MTVRDLPTDLDWSDDDASTGATLPAPRDDKAQRLYNLVFVLRWSPRPLTLEQLRERTGYYRQDDHAAARRQFERDKRDLLAAGVPLETRDGPDGPAYTIDRRTAALPTVELTPDEVAVLSLAANAARDGRARQAFDKLAARAPRPAGGEHAGAGADVVVDDAPVEVLRAVRERRIVRFDYPGSDGVTERVVYPYRLVQRRGAWYVRGLDRDRAAQRTFRLDRVVGALRVDVNPWAFPPPHPDEVAGEVVPEWPEGLVDVDVVADPPAHGVLERAGARGGEVEADGRRHYHLRDADRRSALALLASHADLVTVTGPDEVRAALVAHLRAVADGVA